ncbi:MAG: hypothetical protein K5697_10170 [Lachnospiraceae bacterium]|nr:hypothetical protein [Lachnospiraceae bacterium]
MIKGIHHISMKCNTEEEINRVKEFYISVLGLKIIREWHDGFMIDSDPEYPIRLAFCFGPLGEQIEFFCERAATR